RTSFASWCCAPPQAACPLRCGPSLRRLTAVFVTRLLSLRLDSGRARASPRRGALRGGAVGRRIFRAQALPALDLLLLRLDHLCRDVEERRARPPPPAAGRRSARA